MPTKANETLESAIAPSSDGFPMRLQNSDVFDETSWSATAPSSDLPMQLQRQHSSVSSYSTDGNSDKSVNTKSANPDADFLSNENHYLSKPVDVPNLFSRQPGDTHVTPRYHDSTVISGSPSQNAGVGHINVVFDSAAMPTRSPQCASFSVAHRDVDVTSREMFVDTDIFPMDETPGPHILPTDADMSTSQLQLTDAAVLGTAPPGKSEAVVVLPNVRLDNRNTNAIVPNPPLDVVSNSVGSSPLSIVYPDHVNVTSGEMFSAIAVSDAAPPGKPEVELPKVLLDDRYADVIVPDSPLNCSAPAPTVNLPFLPTTTSRFESNKELAMLDAQDSPVHSASIPEASNFVAPSVAQNGNANCISVVPLRHDDQSVGFLEPQQSAAKDISEPRGIQVTDLSRPMDVPRAMEESQIVGVPQSAVALQPYGCHPTDVPRTIEDICQGTDMPQYLDVDVDMFSDFDGSAGDDENQSGDSDQILNSATYHQLKTQPVS